MYGTQSIIRTACEIKSSAGRKSKKPFGVKHNAPKLQDFNATRGLNGNGRNGRT